MRNDAYADCKCLGKRLEKRSDRGPYQDGPLRHDKSVVGTESGEKRSNLHSAPPRRILGSKGVRASLRVRLSHWAQKRDGGCGHEGREERPACRLTPAPLDHPRRAFWRPSSRSAPPVRLKNSVEATKVWATPCQIWPSLCRLQQKLVGPRCGRDRPPSRPGFGPPIQHDPTRPNFERPNWTRARRKMRQLQPNSAEFGLDSTTGS